METIGGMIIFAMLLTLFVVILSRRVPILGLVLFGTLFLFGIFALSYKNEMEYLAGAFMLSVFMIGFVSSVYTLIDRQNLELKESNHVLDKRAALNKQKRKIEAEVLKKEWEELLKMEVD